MTFGRGFAETVLGKVRLPRSPFHWSILPCPSFRDCGPSHHMSQEGTAPLPPPPQETKAAVADDGSPYSCAPSSVSKKDDGEARGPAPVIATATATASSSSDAVIAGSLEQASAATGAASIKVLTSTGAHTTTFVSSNDASSPSPTEPPCAAGLPKNEENGDAPLNSNERTSLGHEPEGRTSSAGATVEGRGQGGGVRRRH